VDPLLRREVELPLRAHQRVPFYLCLASLLLSLLICLDAALCAHPPARPAAREPAAARAHAAVRLTRSPCRAAARRASATALQHTAAPDPQLEAFQEDFRRDAARQLDNAWAAVDGADAFPNGKQHSAAEALLRGADRAPRATAASRRPIRRAALDR
jgi:hypothetical protein